MIGITRKQVMTVLIIILGCIFVWLFSNISSELNNTVAEFDYNRFKTEVKDENLVRDYDEFEKLESVVQTYIQTLQNEKATDTYALLTKNMKEVYPLRDYKKLIEQYTNDNLVETGTNKFYNTDDIITSVNKIDTSNGLTTYLVKYKNKNNEIKQLGILLDEQYYKYYIASIEM